MRPPYNPLPPHPPPKPHRSRPSKWCPSPPPRSPLHQNSSSPSPRLTLLWFSAAEEVAGEYVWGVYDLLLLPPSFPYGGMENPCLTFVTPTLLAGDRSLVNVVAHEIAHSWTGNLVTNATWEHFWLNEGVSQNSNIANRHGR